MMAELMKMVGLFVISNLRCNHDYTVQRVDFVLVNYESLDAVFDVVLQHNFRGCFE